MSIIKNNKNYGTKVKIVEVEPSPFSDYLTVYYYAPTATDSFKIAHHANNITGYRIKGTQEWLTPPNPFAIQVANAGLFAVEYRLDDNTEIETEQFLEYGYDVEFPSTITTLNGDAFMGWSDFPIEYIGNNITTIGAGALSSLNRMIVIDDNRNYTVDKSAFNTNILTYINGALYGIPEGINGQNIDIMDYSNGIEGLGTITKWYKQFDYYAHKTMIKFPSTITEITDNVLGSETNVSFVFFGNPVPPTVNGEGNVFNNDRMKIYVPDASVNAYKQATGFTNVASRIYPVSDFVLPQLQPFYFEDLSGQTNNISINGYGINVEVYASSDGENWNYVGESNSDGGGCNITLPANGKVYITTNSDRLGTDWGEHHHITCDGNYKIGGDLVALLVKNAIDPDQYTALYNVGQWSCFQQLFEGSTTLIDASDVIFPIMSGNGAYCYSQMFKDCTNLTDAPDMNIDKIGHWDCYLMYGGCTSLVTAPVLGATELSGEYGYCQMFKDCTALTTVPALPATYVSRLYYQSMFEGCTSLVTAPVINATSLGDEACNSMFKDCTSLNRVTVYISNTGNNGTINWLDNVSSTGDFYNLGTATYASDDPSGIPTGWTEHTSL